MSKFKKGDTPHNKGKKFEDYLSEESVEKVKKTQYKKGQTAGENSNTWKGGIQEMSNDCVHLYKGVGKRVRRPREIYTKYFGEIPKGYVVIHIDGNKHNDDPSNLKAISRAENLKRNIEQ